MPDDTKVVDVDSPKQLKEGKALIDKCKEIYDTARRNDLAWRWLIGQKVEETYKNKEKYDSGILKTLSETLDITISDLSRFKKFYIEFNDIKLIEDAATKGYSWSHFKIVNDLPDGLIKQNFKTNISESEQAPKTVEFQKEIDKKRIEQLDAANTPDQVGGGGSGEGGSVGNKNSPFKPLNKALKNLESLGDFLGDLLIIIDEGVDFDDNEKQGTKFAEAISELTTKLDEVVAYRDKIKEAIV